MQKTKYGTYAVRWRHNGKHRARTFKTKILAQKFEAQLRLNEADTRLPNSVIKFENFSTMWHENYCKVEKSESQWVDDWSIIKIHLNPTFGSMKLCDLTKFELMNLRAALKNGGKHAPKTINNITGLAKKMLNDAVDWELLRENPFRSIKPLKVPPQPFGYWTADERDRFLRFCKRKNPDLWRIVGFTCHTGLRLGEVMGLERRNLDFERKTVLVTQAYSTKVEKIVPYTKGKRMRQIEMNDLVYEVLKETQLMSPKTPIFGTKLKYSSKKVRRISNLAGVKSLCFHELRHTFASCLAMAGVPLHKIQVLLGHQNIQETQRYAHLHPDSLEGITKILVRDLCVEEKSVL